MTTKPNYFQQVDVNELISEMRRRPALWNQKHVLYHNREVTNRMWIELSAILNVQKPYIKTKWKGLRDTFRCELKKEQIFRRTNHKKKSTFQSTWRHYKQLFFLKGQMLPTPPMTNSPENDCDPLSLEEFAKRFATKTSPGAAKSQKKKRNRSAAPPMFDSSMEAANFVTVKEEPEDIVNIPELGIFETAQLEQNLNCGKRADALSATPNSVNSETSNSDSTDLASSSDQMDDSYHFLMSLLPHLQKVSAERQMLLRMQIQELVYKEAYKQDDQ